MNNALTTFHKGQHLKEDQIIEAFEECPLCGSRKQRGKEIFIQKNPDVWLLSCSNCGGMSASHMPNDSVLEDYYNKYYDANNDSDSNNITFGNAHRFAKHILKYISIRDYKGETFRILDFGGGDGSLAVALAKQIRSINYDIEIEISVVDFNTSRINIVNEYTLKNYYKLDEVEGKFNLVLCSAIIEHIPYVKNVLLHIFSLIDENGYFYARTPYIYPLKKIFPFIDFTYPGHVHDLGPEFWNKIYRELEIEINLVNSQPSIVETSVRDNYFRTIVAYLLKVPAHMELRLFRKNIPFWKLIGGWEVVLQK